MENNQQEESGSFRDLDKLEIQPPEAVWNRIDEELPRNPLLRRSLFTLAKIAACVLVVMLLSLLTRSYLSNDPTTNQSAQLIQEDEIATDNPDPSATTNEPEFVFELDKGAGEEEMISVQQILNEETDLETEPDYFALIMQEDAFETTLDLQHLQEILEPTRRLPIEDLSVLPKRLANKKPLATSASDTERDLQITVPLKVVEEYEVEALLSYYEKMTRKRNP